MSGQDVLDGSWVRGEQASSEFQDGLDAETQRNLLDVLPGETAVRISPQVVIEALRRYQGGR